jgi:DNA-binding transcriptional LysR family regulator
MHLNRLHYFVVTAEEESVARAARRLRVAQPALSRQLAALEREVGTQLFERHARGVRLLPAGEAFLTHARRLLAEADRGLLAARSTGLREASAHVRLASPDWTARGTWVARALDRLHSLRPDVVAEHVPIMWLEQETAVRNGGIDVGFAIAMSAADIAEDVEGDRISDEPASVAILPAAHPLARRSSVMLADLRDVTLLAPPREIAPRLHDQTVALVRTGGYEPRVASSSPSFSAAVQHVVAGAGWIVAINSVAEALPPDASAVPISDASVVLGFYLLRRRGDPNEAVDAFADCLHAVARGETVQA